MSASEGLSLENKQESVCAAEAPDCVVYKPGLRSIEADSERNLPSALKGSS